MADPEILQTNFASGQLSTSVQQRVDIEAYANGAAFAENTFLLEEGGIQRRPGMVYINTLRGPSQLHRFAFGKGQRYLFVFSDTALDIYLNDSLVESHTDQPWTAAMIGLLRVTQVGNTMIVMHEDLPTRKVVRTGADTFTVSDFEWETHSSGWPVFAPFYKFADTNMTLTPSGTTGSITVTLSAGYWKDEHAGVIVRHKGKQIEINTITDDTTAQATVRENLTDTSATIDWDEEAFSAVAGYPRCGTFHQRRLFLGGSKELPSHFWGSKTGAPFNFDEGTQLPNEAIVQEASDDEVQTLMHLISGRHLQCFCDGAAFYVPHQTNSALTPENARCLKQVPFGVTEKAVPVNFDGATVFAQAEGKSVREFLYTNDENAYAGPQVSVLWGDLVKNPVSMASHKGDSNMAEQYAVIVNEDGTAAQFHSNRQQNITGFVPWYTNGQMASVADVDHIYLAVDRGGTWFLERMDHDVTLDCCTTSSEASPTLVHTGFDHLANETVKVVDGTVYLGEYTVAPDGTITLNEGQETTSITGGLDYAVKIRPLSPEMQLNDGSTFSKPLSIIDATLQLQNTYSLATSSDELTVEIDLEDPSNPPGALTGRYRLGSLGWALSPEFDLYQPDPLPLQIDSMSMRVMV